MNNLARQKNNLPASIAEAKRFVPLWYDKTPKADWQEQRNWRKLDELDGDASFVVTSQNEIGGYVFFNLNNVFGDVPGMFLSEDIAAWYQKLIGEVGSYCEISQSGRGLHIFIQPAINDHLPKGLSRLVPDKDFPEAKIEAYYRTNMTCLLTGKCFNCKPAAPIVKGKDADRIFINFLKACGKTVEELKEASPALNVRHAAPIPPARTTDKLSKDELDRLVQAIKVIEPDEVAARLGITRAKNGGYVCPACSNGEGKDATGIEPKFWKDHWEWHCMKCDETFDNIKLIARSLGKDMNGKDFIEVVKEGAQLFALGFTPAGELTAPPAVKNFTPPPETPVKDFSKTFYPFAQSNLKTFLRKCRDGIWRGFTEKTLQHFRCGYTDSFGKAQTPTVIIPYNNNHYFARFVGDEAKLTPDQKKDLRPKYHTAGSKPIFNIKLALGNDNPVCFVVESATDAMSIWQAGKYNVIAVSGSSLTESMRNQLAPFHDKKFIVMLDSDETGQAKKKKLCDQLVALGHKAFSCVLSDTHKDANDFLQADPAAFAQRLKDIYAAAEKTFDATNIPEQAHEWQRRNGTINPETLTDVLHGKEYLDAITPESITPAIAQSAKTKHSLALCVFYDFFADAYDTFFAKLANAKSLARAEMYQLKEAGGEFVANMPENLIAITNINVANLRKEIDSLVKSYRKAHKEFVKTEAQRKVREETAEKEKARRLEIADANERLNFLKTQAPSPERDARIVNAIHQLCSWKNDAKGNPIAIAPKQGNADLIFGNDPALEGLFGYDEFHQADVFLKAPPWKSISKKGDLWVDEDVAQLRTYLRRYYADFANKDLVDDNVVEYSRAHAFHEVKDFFNSLPEWDGTPRAETLFIDWLKVADTPYVREVTRKWLLAAVARIFNPGCAFQWAIVLHGKQGIGKSYILEQLGGKWFSAIVDEVNDSHAIDALQNTWIAEFKEMSGMRKDVNANKSFIERAEDNRRAAYHKRASKFKRHNVFGITVNDDQFLADMTGNRRYQILNSLCNAGEPVNEVRGERLSDDKTIAQIWAEVFALYNSTFVNGFNSADLILSESARRAGEEIAELYTNDNGGIEGEIQAFVNAKIPPLVIWNLLSREQRREFFAKGCCIALYRDDLINKRRSCGGHNVEEDVDKINELCTTENQVGEFKLYRFYGTEHRQHICAAEIIDECFDANNKRVSANRVNEIMPRLAGWTIGSRISRDPVYGDQRKVYYCIANNKPADDMDFGGVPISPLDVPFDDNTKAPLPTDKPAACELNPVNDTHAATADNRNFPSAPIDPDEVPF